MPMSSEADDREDRREPRPERPDAIRVARRAAGSGRTWRVMRAPPTREAARGPGEDRRRLRMRARRGGVPDLELERLEPTELAAGEPSHDVDPVALGDEPGDVRADRRRCRRGRRGRGAGSATCGRRRRGRTRITVRPEHGDERLRVARPVGREPGQVAMQGVVDGERRDGQVDGAGPAADRAARRPRRAPRNARRTRSQRSGRRSRTRPRRRDRRGAGTGRRRRSRASPRSIVPALRHEARIVSPRSAPTTAGRARSSASREATRPTMPTGHGPWTIAAGRSGSGGDDGSGLGHGGRHQVAPGGVGGLQVGGVDGRGRRRHRPAGGAAASQRLPHPPGRVEPRGDGERHAIEVDVRRGEPGRIEQRGDARAAAPSAAAPGRAGRWPGSRRRSARRPRPSRSSRGRPGRGPPRPGRSSRAAAARP